MIESTWYGLYEDKKKQPIVGISQSSISGVVNLSREVTVSEFVIFDIWLWFFQGAGKVWFKFLYF